MAMAAHLLTQSETLTIARLFRPSSLVGTAIPSSSSPPCLRVLYYLASPPLLRPLHDSRSAVPMLDSAGALPHKFNAVVGSRRIWVYEQMSKSHPIKLVHAGTHGLPRWLSGMTHGGTVTHLSKNIISQLCNSTEKNVCNSTSPPL